MTDIAFTNDVQLVNLLQQANDLEKRANLPHNLEAYKAMIDMQGMIALYAKENINKLRTERGEDPNHGPSADPANQRFWKDLADSKEWAIQEPLNRFFSETHSSNNSSWQESWMEVSGDTHLDTKSFFSGVKKDWMKMKDVQGGIEELVKKFLAKCDEVDLKNLNEKDSPQAQQCISIGIVGDQNATNTSFNPYVSILWVGLELRSTQALTGGGGSNHGEKIRARIDVSQSTFQAYLNFDAIRDSQEYLDTTRKKMIDLGLDDFARVLA